MKLKNGPQENHMAGIIRLLSMYQALQFQQLMRAFSELPEEKLLSIIRRLVKSGRIIFRQEQDLLLYAAGCTPDPDRIAAFWVLLDFLPEVTYHTASDFPVALTFYTSGDAYDIIHVPLEKETLMNHVLSAHKENVPRRLIIVDRTEQIPHLTFPGITAFCTVMPGGEIQYFKKQGATSI